MTDSENKKKIIWKESREIWQGKKIKKIEVEGIGRNKKEAQKDAIKKLIEQISCALQDNKYLPENVSLLLTKYIPLIAKEENYSVLEKDIFHKKEYFSLLSLIIKKIEKKSVYDNQNKIVLEGFNTLIDTTLETSNRMVCGLGASSVLETSITLHHIWGVPYIPASSFKGVCREVAFWKLVEERNIKLDNLEDQKEQKRFEDFQKEFYGELYINDCNDIKIFAYQLLFGAQDFKGLLLFLDIYPDLKDCNNNILEMDIMNPHYSEYYNDQEGKTPPGDWENPVPIFFLTVKTGIKFNFRVLFDEWRWNKIKSEGITIKRNNENYHVNFSDHNEFDDKNKIVFVDIKEIENLLTGEDNFLKNIIIDALTNYGVGAKRNLGYGNFKIQNNK